jgi:hypothetical protein
MFDAWAPALHGDDLFEAARKMGGITVHSTVANYQRLRRFRYDPSITNYVPQVPELQAVAIEDGFIDYRAFFQALCGRRFRWERRLRDLLADPGWRQRRHS